MLTVFGRFFPRWLERSDARQAACQADEELDALEAQCSFEGEDGEDLHDPKTDGRSFSKPKVGSPIRDGQSAPTATTPHATPLKGAPPTTCASLDPPAESAHQAGQRPDMAPELSAILPVLLIGALHAIFLAIAGRSAAYKALAALFVWSVVATSGAMCIALYLQRTREECVIGTSFGSVSTIPSRHHSIESRTGDTAQTIKELTAASSDSSDGGNAPPAFAHPQQKPARPLLMPVLLTAAAAALLTAALLLSLAAAMTAGLMLRQNKAAPIAAVAAIAHAALLQAAAACACLVTLGVVSTAVAAALRARDQSESAQRLLLRECLELGRAGLYAALAPAYVSSYYAALLLFATIAASAVMVVPGAVCVISSVLLKMALGRNSVADFIMATGSWLISLGEWLSLVVPVMWEAAASLAVVVGGSMLVLLVMRVFRVTTLTAGFPGLLKLWLANGAFWRCSPASRLPFSFDVLESAVFAAHIQAAAYFVRCPTRAR